MLIPTGSAQALEAVGTIKGIDSDKNFLVVVAGLGVALVLLVDELLPLSSVRRHRYASRIHLTTGPWSGQMERQSLLHDWAI